VDETTAQPPAQPSEAGDAEDLDTKVRKWREQRNRDYKSLRSNSRALWRAMEKWQTVRDADEWAERYVQAHEDYRSGKFLVEQFGGDMYVDPDETAVFLGLRRSLDENDSTAAEAMVADLALISYRNALRVQGWIGNAAYLIEHELFGQDSPTAKFKQQHGYSVNGLKVEDTVAGLVRELVPLFDRCNRAVLRNLQARKALRNPAVPTVAITSAGQVNVGAQQTNMVQASGTAEPEPSAESAGPRRLRPVGEEIEELAAVDQAGEPFLRA
jgi:hypothetical protein